MWFNTIVVADAVDQTLLNVSLTPVSTVGVDLELDCGRLVKRKGPDRRFDSNMSWYEIRVVKAGVHERAQRVSPFWGL